MPGPRPVPRQLIRSGAWKDISSEHKRRLGEVMSLVDAVAWTAGQYDCCVVLAAFGRTWNDGLRNDSERNQQLLRYVEPLGGTDTTTEVQRHRAELALWWLIRDYTPVWLDLAGMDGHAAELRAMQRLDQRCLTSASVAAGHAARGAGAALGNTEIVVDEVTATAVLASAGAAAWSAVLEAFGSETFGLGQSVEMTAADAAWAAAKAAAKMVAAQAMWVGAVDEHWETLQRAAVCDVLEPTVQTLLGSAHRLFDDMINVTSDMNLSAHSL